MFSYFQNIFALIGGTYTVLCYTVYTVSKKWECYLYFVYWKFVLFGIVNYFYLGSYGVICYNMWQNYDIMLALYCLLIKYNFDKVYIWPHPFTEVQKDNALPSSLYLVNYRRDLTSFFLLIWLIWLLNSINSNDVLIWPNLLNCELHVNQINSNENDHVCLG